MATDNLARGLASAASTHPGFIAGRWYSCAEVALAAGAAFAASSIRLLPFNIVKPIKVQALGARISTANAGNCQLALYAHDPVLGVPTGAALCSTASLSTGVATTVSGAVTPVTLPPGTYWMAVNQDNAVAAYLTLSNAFTQGAALMGSTTLANAASGAGTAPLGLSFAQTFGTWPNLTGQSLTEFMSNTSALVFMQAS